jgi:predicted anti-sigma-YlaC factor YlaD
MDCKTATALMSQGMDRPLDTSERVSLKVHTLMCTGCRNYRLQLQVLRDAARQMAHGLVPPGVDEPGSATDSTTDGTDPKA